MLELLPKMQYDGEMYRPIRLKPYIDEGAWEVAYQKVVIAYGVPSDVLIVRARES